MALTTPRGDSRISLLDGDIPGARTVEIKPALTDSMSHYTVIHIQWVRLGAWVDVKPSPDSKLSEESRRIHLSGKGTRERAGWHQGDRRGSRSWHLALKRLSFNQASRKTSALDVSEADSTQRHKGPPVTSCRDRTLSHRHSRSCLSPCHIKSHRLDGFHNKAIFSESGTDG